MRHARRLVVAAIAAAMLAAACTGGTGSTGSTSTGAAPTGAGPAPRIPVVEETSAPTLAAAIRHVCDPPSVPDREEVEPGPADPEVTRIEDLVESARGLTFVEPVAAEAISDAVMDEKIAENFELFFPERPLARRSAAWRTMGVIPPDGDLHSALAAFQTGGVIGFYDPATKELVYLADDSLGLLERQTLAHELVHALEDQRFDLERLDPLIEDCTEEPYQAALGFVEGSAQYYSLLAVTSDPALGMEDLADAFFEGLTAGSAPPGVPPFVMSLQMWPYIHGQGFVAALDARGGRDEVDGAYRELPVSTEQILHPERYPDDVPRQVEIADMTAALGGGWGDLDAMLVGEQWLRSMLELRLDPGVAADAADGWDGAAYRAWTDGDDVVVVLRTAWDSRADAEAFEDAATAWVGDGTATVHRDGDEVTLVFANDPDLVVDPDAGGA